jgi:hypothetical protein
MHKHALTLMVIVLMVACSHYRLISPEDRVKVLDYTVEPQIEWSRITEADLVVWTVDGPSLEAVQFFKPIRDGYPLFSFYDDFDDYKKLPVFKKDMTAIEILEFVTGSMIMAGGRRQSISNMMGINVAGKNLRPFRFGNHPGFRFDITFLSPGGLAYSGFVVGSVIDEKLYLVAYTGTHEYYFPKHKDAAERLILSIETP